MSLVLGKVWSSTMKQTIKVGVPRLKFDPFLNMHFREPDPLLVHDPEEKCKPGDWILIREMPQRLSLQVNHRVEKIVYSAGKVIDPITGKQALGYEYVEHVNKQGKLFSVKPFDQRN